MSMSGASVRTTYNIWDVQNEMRARREFVRNLHAALSRSITASGSSLDPVFDVLEQQEEWLTEAIAAIDRGQGQPTEAEE